VHQRDIITGEINVKMYQKKLIGELKENKSFF